MTTEELLLQAKQDFDDVRNSAYEKGYEKGKADGRQINPNWTRWDYFDYYDSRNDLVADLRYTDTSKGTSFVAMFRNSDALKEVPLFDTSKGTSFREMFYSANGIRSIPCYNTSQGTSFKEMFYYSSLQTIPELDTSNGTDFEGMFSRSSIKEVRLNTDKASYMTEMFYNCTSLTKVSLSSTAKSNYLESLFYGCKNLVTIENPITIKSGAYKSNMFFNCSKLENVTFDAVYVSSSFSSFLSYSPLLTVESLMSLINACINTSTSSTYTVTIGSTNLAKLTQEQIDIATAKRIKLA